MDTSRYAALFFTESREHLAAMDTALLAIEQDRQVAHVDTLFRGMHTIKGMAAAMAFEAVEQVAHALEARCDPLRRGEVPLTDYEIAALFDGVDRLRATVDDAANGQTALTPTAAVPSSPPSPTNRRVVEIRLVADCPLPGVRAVLVLARVRSLLTVRSTQPPEATWAEEKFDGAFAITVEGDAEERVIVESVRGAGDVARVEVVDARDREAAPTQVARTVRIDASRLDALLDLAGELVITRDRLVRALEAADGPPDRQVQRATRETARLISALHTEVLEARMLPVREVFDRFPRLVRDTARELGKEVMLSTEGQEIALDRSLLDAIGEPLLHLLRNALDHGMELPDDRERVGKPRSGQLVLRAARDRASVVIQVQDDGRGIDRDAVRTRAAAQGLIPDSMTTLSDEALLNVLAHPGFSMATHVSTLSGRGVGVDVVNTRVRALGGHLELETLAGAGTVFTLRLPVTLAIARAVIVRVGTSLYAIPAAQVVEVVDAEQRDLSPGRDAMQRETVTVRDHLMPLVDLAVLFDEEILPATVADGGQYLAVVESAGRRAALLVDGLVAQQDIVVKGLDPVRGGSHWFSGATILGDGTPALIVDVHRVV